MNLIIFAVVVAIAVVAATIQLVGMIGDDGYGHNPPPRSHRDEESITQHEQLRRLAR